MKLKLDENLGARVLEFLKSAGHDVATVAGQGLSSASDVIVASVCQKESRCLVTLDLDFANPLAFPPSKHAGLAVLRVGDRITWPRLLAALETLNLALKTAEIRGKLWIVEPGRYREHEPLDRGTP